MPSRRLPAARRRATAFPPASLLLALVLSGSPALARADYLCQPLDVPGATWTQVWQLNDAGQIAAGSSLGGHVYSGGAWLPLAPPPASSGYALADVSALGINDAGVLAGGAASSEVSVEQGFILTGGRYEFFSYRPESYLRTEARAISGSGIVTGTAYGTDGAGVGFVYNPGAAPGYAAGFTEIQPALPDGTLAWATIPGTMNAMGQLVGSASFAQGRRYGFLYDPGWQAHGQAGPVTLFQIDGRWTAARGLNDKGYVAGFTRSASGAVVGFLMTGAGHQLVTCPQLAGATGVYPESINDSDVLSGIWSDASGGMHGLVAYPNVVLPIATVGGAFVFDVAVSPATPVFLDPAVAVGYRYAIGEGNPPFTSVTLPIGIGDDVYTVLAGGRAFTLAAGQAFDFTRNGFPQGVAGFAVLGIETSANLDPANANAFVTEVKFGAGGNGRFTGTMKPMTAADEIDDLLGAVNGAGPGRSLAAKLGEARRAYAAGDVAGACDALAGFVGEVSAQSGKKIPPPLAAALVAEARAAESAVSCPAP